MTNPAAGWTRISDISDGEEGDLILAVDYYGTGRRGTTFRDLVGLLPRHLEVWHAVAPLDGHRPDISARDYLTWWCDDLVRSGTPPRAVFGYCAGAVFASAVADEIERHNGSRPAVVLFDPDKPTVDTLGDDFSGIIDSMTVLTEEERAEIRRRAAEIRSLHGDDFETVSAEFLAIYQKAYDVVFDRLGIERQVGEQLTRVFASYVRYLSAARQLGHLLDRESAPALISRDHQHSAAVRPEIGFDVGRAELLGGLDVATAAYDLIMAGK
jgi:dienelactone hydrolase